MIEKSVRKFLFLKNFSKRDFAKVININFAFDAKPVLQNKIYLSREIKKFIHVK